MSGNDTISSLRARKVTWSSSPELHGMEGRANICLMQKCTNELRSLTGVAKLNTSNDTCLFMPEVPHSVKSSGTLNGYMRV